MIFKVKVYAKSDSVLHVKLKEYLTYCKKPHKIGSIMFNSQRYIRGINKKSWRYFCYDKSIINKSRNR
jgi:hypothetical protein